MHGTNMKTTAQCLVTTSYFAITSKTNISDICCPHYQVNYASHHSEGEQAYKTLVCISVRTQLNAQDIHSLSQFLSLLPYVTRTIKCITEHYYQKTPQKAMMAKQTQ
jgi:hypothetical protein